MRTPGSVVRGFLMRNGPTWLRNYLIRWMVRDTVRRYGDVLEALGDE